MSFILALWLLNLALELGPASRFPALVAVLCSLLFIIAGFAMLFLGRLQSESGEGPRYLGRARPSVVFMLIVAIFVANYLAVGMRVDVYPFYSVQMFSGLGSESTVPQKYLVEKYAYEDEGKTTVLDLRKEGSLLFQNSLPWNFGHSASFSTTFHNRAKAENLHFLEKQTGQTLFVIVQEVDLASGEVSLVGGLCAYRDLREEIDQYYGPLRVPRWQSEECHS